MSVKSSHHGSLFMPDHAALKGTAPEACPPATTGHLKRLPTLMGAAALLLLASACGGGSSSGDSNVSSSPNAPGSTTPGNTQTPGTTSPGNQGALPGGTQGGSGGTGSSNPGGNAGGGSGGSNPSANTGGGAHSSNAGGNAGSDHAGGSSPGNDAGGGNAGNQPPAALPKPPIAADSISAELLAAMLSERLGGPYPTSAGSRGEKTPLELKLWTDEPSRGERVAIPDLFDVWFYAGLHDKKTDRAMWNDNGLTGAADPALINYITDTSSRYDVNLLESRIPFKQAPNADMLRDSSGLAAYADAPAGTELLQLQTNGRVRWRVHGKVIADRWLRDALGEWQDVPLTASQPYSIRKGERLPVNQVIQTWKNDRGHLTELLVIKPQHLDEVRLCVNVHVPDIKRLTCSRWTAPAGWKLGQAPTYAGSYIVDDRSLKEGQSGLRYWARPSPDQGFDDPVRPGQGTDRLLSDKGIHMNVLTAMLRDWGNPANASLGNTQARRLASDTSASDGHDVLNSTHRYVPLHAWPDIPYLRIDTSPVCCNTTHPLASVEMTVNVDLTPRDRPTAILPARDLMPRLTVASSSAHGGQSKQDYSFHAQNLFNSPTGFSDGSGDNLVPFGPIQRWVVLGTPGAHVNLSLKKGEEAGTAQLCWQTVLPRLLKREVCDTWHVPADWTPDKPLRATSFLVTDDGRFEGGNGQLRRWRQQAGN